MSIKFTKTIALSVALAALSTVLAMGAGQAGKNVSNLLTRAGSGGVQNANSGSALDVIGEFRNTPEVDAQFNKGGISLSRVPSSGVPRPSNNGLTALDPGFLGFPGVNHRQQRLADNGHQFSLEPPDPAMAVGPNQVVSAVNTALGVYDKAGNLLANVASLNRFFGLPSEVVRDAQGKATYGPFLSDPKVLFDSVSGRWFVSILEVDQDPATGNWLNTTAVYLAVSQTSDATGVFNIYRLNTSDIGLPDQPLIGLDANGLYVSVNAFAFPDFSFSGGIIYAISKAALVSGTLGSAVRFDGLVQAEGPGYSIQPANVPPNGPFADANGGTEYFLSALDFNGTLDNWIAAWAITGTASLGASPNLSIQNVVLDTIVYGQPPAAQQKPGPTPLGDTLRSGALGQRFPEKLPLLDSNDDRMNQVCYAAGCLWGGVNTVIKAPNGPTRVGVAYFAVKPSWNAGILSGQVMQAGYVAVNQENLLYPAIAVNNDGKGIIAFTLVGPDYFPSAAYAPLSLDSGAGAVRIAGPGTEPADGFSGYRAFSGGNVERWGDYHTAVVDSDGSFWFTAQCNLGGPRTFYANWSTYIGHVSY